MMILTWTLLAGAWFFGTLVTFCLGVAEAAVGRHKRGIRILLFCWAWPIILCALWAIEIRAMLREAFPHREKRVNRELGPHRSTNVVPLRRKGGDG